jgi:hypothetical protein
VLYSYFKKEAQKSNISSKTISKDTSHIERGSATGVEDKKPAPPAPQGIPYDPRDITGMRAIRAEENKQVNSVDALRKVQEKLLALESAGHGAAAGEEDDEDAARESSLLRRRGQNAEESRSIYASIRKDFIRSNTRRGRQGFTGLQRVRLFCYYLLGRTWFEILLALIILFNTGIMAAQHYGQPGYMKALSEVVNYVATALFVIEMVVKHLAYGFRTYWTNGYDVFDGLIIVASSECNKINSENFFLFLSVLHHTE